MLGIETIVSNEQKSGMEHFIAKWDLLPNPEEALGKAYQYLAGLKLNSLIRFVICFICSIIHILLFN